MARSTRPWDSGPRGRHWMTRIPSIPRNASNSSVNLGRPPRHSPTADSLSQISARGAAPHPCSSCQCPAIRRRARGQHRRGHHPRVARDHHQHRRPPGLPEPQPHVDRRKHKSHCASPPGSYPVRAAGSGGANNGRNAGSQLAEDDEASSPLPKVEVPSTRPGPQICPTARNVRPSVTSAGGSAEIRSCLVPAAIPAGRLRHVSALGRPPDL